MLKKSDIGSRMREICTSGSEEGAARAIWWFYSPINQLSVFVFIIANLKGIVTVSFTIVRPGNCIGGQDNMLIGISGSSMNGK